MDTNLRIRICSTGLATTVLTVPANAPEAHNSPRPSSAPPFRLLKNRLAASIPLNWIETHAPISSAPLHHIIRDGDLPIPRSGVKVPYISISHSHTFSNCIFRGDDTRRDLPYKTPWVHLPSIIPLHILKVKHKFH
jgi:hypothetical protein